MLQSAETKCLTLAARQFGVIRRDQVLGQGLTRAQLRTRLASGRWALLYPAVYRVVGAPESWWQRLKALCLWAERGVAVSHRSAAALHGFSRFSQGPLEMSLTRKARAPEGTRVIHVGALSARDLASVEGLTVTSVTRTLLDLSAESPEATLRASLDEALRRRWTTPERLEAALEQAGQRPGVRTLRLLVDEVFGVGGPTDSELEAMGRELLAANGFTRVRCQKVVVVRGRRRRLDLSLEGTPVVIELDGYAYHSGKGRFEDDRARNNALAARGFVLLHWTWDAVMNRPQQLIAELRQVLRTRGLLAGAGALQWNEDAPG